MEASLSPKVLFYLEHRSLIDEWSGLEAKAVDELHAWLCGWGEVMESSADEERELFQSVHDDLYPKLLWTQPGWMPGLEHASRTRSDQPRPLVGIGVEWIAKNPHHENGVYVGIWIDRKAELVGGVRLHDEICERIDAKDFGGKTVKSWPVKANAEPLGRAIGRAARQSSAGDDQRVIQQILEEYRAEQLDRIETIWRDCAGPVDEAVRATTGYRTRSDDGSAKNG